MKTLEEIYQQYFDCEKPFHKSGRLTKEGAKAHERLVQLIEDLEALGVCADARLTVCQLDDISGEGISYKQEMVNDLYRFLPQECEEYVLNEPVNITWDGRSYRMKYLSRDSDYQDIFMAEVPWNNEGDNFHDLIDFTQLSDKDAQKVFEAVMCQEIDGGWEWMEHARDALREKFPDADDELIDYFVCTQWQNCKTDAWNCEQFMDAE